MIDKKKYSFFYPYSIDFDKLIADYPPYSLYFDTVWKWSRDQILALQESRLKSAIARAWEIPFYKRIWAKKGFAPEDFTSLEDIAKIPSFTVYDLRDSLEKFPPFGDYQGVTPLESYQYPLVMQHSGGTTGLPRPMFYSPIDREVAAMVSSRSFYMQGIGRGDLVQITYTFSAANAGHMARELIWKYTGAVPLPTGTGNETRTSQQIELARRWGTTAIMGSFDYIRHIGLEAIKMGIDPRKDLKIRKYPGYFGRRDRKEIEDLFGADVYDNYGTHETVMNVASECRHKNGKHIFEDAYFIEIIDPQSGKQVPTGEKGNIVITTLFKYAAPLIRYDVNDISAILPGKCSCGSETLRLDCIYGRADNMVKLRGINVFPEAVGSIISKDSRTTGEYLCVVEHVANQDEMTVMVERKADISDTNTLQSELEAVLKAGTGVRLKVDIVGPDELEPQTGKTTTHKVKRLLDKR